MSVNNFDCMHRDCEGPVREDAADPVLPPHIEPFECFGCGERYLLDVETGEVEIDA